MTSLCPSALLLSMPLQLRACRVTHEEKKQAFASAASQSDLVVKMMAAAAPGGPLARAGLHGRLGMFLLCGPPHPHVHFVFAVALVVKRLSHLLCTAALLASGNLGAIDPAYDVAVTTACPQLDNFVVDTAVGAQRCVDYLRTINGRGKFIILEEVSALVA